MKPLQAFLSDMYRIGYGLNPGWSALADLSETIENKLGPAAEEYDELVNELEKLRQRITAFEKLQQYRRYRLVRPNRRTLV